MTLILIGVYLIEVLSLEGDPRFPGAETRPNVGPRHRLGRVERARRHPPSSGPRSAPGALTLLATARPRPPGATRDCDAASAGSLPWEDQACGTAVKPPKISSSAGAVSRPDWRRSNPSPHGSPARNARGIHSGV